MLDAEGLPAYSTVARNVAELLAPTRTTGLDPLAEILPRLRLVVP
jgi:hypothetical protein